MGETMMFGNRVLGRPLLALRANRGWRYVIARLAHSGEPLLVSVESSGFMSGHPVDEPVTGASGEPWDTWVAAGQLPQGARSVEIDTGDSVLRGKARAGLWLAGIPWGNRDMEFEVRFLARDGSVVARFEQELTHTRPIAH
jgi:hypothetical protein